MNKVILKGYFDKYCDMAKMSYKQEGHLKPRGILMGKNNKGAIDEGMVSFTGPQGEMTIEQATTHLFQLGYHFSHVDDHEHHKPLAFATILTSEGDTDEELAIVMVSLEGELFIKTYEIDEDSNLKKYAREIPVEESKLLQKARSCSDNFWKGYFGMNI